MQKKVAVAGIIIIVVAIGLVFGLKLNKVNSNLKTSVSVTMDLRKQVDSLTKENEEYKQKISDAQSRTTDLDLEKRNLRDRLAGAQNDLSAARDELKSQADKAAELEKELAPVRELRKQLSEKDKKLKQAEDAAKDYKGDAANLEKELLATKKNLEKAQKQLNTVVGRTEEKVKTAGESEKKKLESGLAAAKNYVKLVEGERDDYLTKMAELKQNLSDALSRMANVTAANNGLREEVADMHYNLGVILAKQNDFRTAIREFEKVLSVKPDDADAHYNLAILYDEKVKDNNKALEHYRAYMKIAPDSKDAKKVSKWIIDKESENKVR